jgi:hypothetical protein
MLSSLLASGRDLSLNVASLAQDACQLLAGMTKREIDIN